MRECTTHHDACACREAMYTMDMAVLKAENARLREALQACIEEMLDAAGAIQLMKDGFDDEEGVDPFDRLRALRHSFFGERDAGRLAREALGLKNKGYQL